MANWDGPCDPVGDLRRTMDRLRESAVGQVHEPPPKPEFPRNPEEWGHSRMERGYAVWSAWQNYLNGRNPTAEEREEMNAALLAAMGEEAASAMSPRGDTLEVQTEVQTHGSA